MAVKRVQATVTGTVQGVGFRYYATHIAHQLGVHGSVRNLPNGDVEAIAEGEENTLNQFIAQLRDGPTTAHVEDIRVAWAEPEGHLADFTAIG